MSQSRRNFLKTIASIGAASTAISAVNPSKINAESSEELSIDRKGVLVDTTVCIGCRKCEWACKGAHNFEQGDFENYQNDETLNQLRRPGVNDLTVVNKYNDDGMRTIKLQCMHCDHPACVSACIVGAITKNENGAVVWDTDKCIGCRYCMVACPFQIPAFEYHKALDPKIVKCDFCIDRTNENKLTGMR